MKHVGIIPARYASTRFPGKPLAILQGKPMIQVVYERVKASALSQVVVATDHPLIQQCVLDFGGEVAMTRPDHPSGTDRCGEVAATLSLNDEDVIVNIQGDEPGISRQEIDLLTSLFQLSGHPCEALHRRGAGPQPQRGKGSAGRQRQSTLLQPLPHPLPA